MYTTQRPAGGRQGYLVAAALLAVLLYREHHHAGALLECESHDLQSKLALSAAAKQHEADLSALRKEKKKLATAEVDLEKAKLERTFQEAASAKSEEVAPPPPASPTPSPTGFLPEPPPAPAADTGPVIVVPGGSAPRSFSKPPKTIPADLLAEYTLDGRIPVYYAYSDDQTGAGNGEGGQLAKVINYPKSKIDSLVQEARQKHAQYYGDVDLRLFNILDRHPDLLRGKDVAILGSLEPWYEAVAIAYGAGSVTTIEYGPRTTDDPRLAITTPMDFAASPRTFDVALSISSFEHDGLGRYGDPLSAVGDLRAMAETAQLLRPGGHLLLAVPRGSDAVKFNHHRIYGPIRWPMLTAGWTELDADGPLDEIKILTGTSEAQPVYLLTPFARFTNFSRT